MKVTKSKIFIRAPGGNKRGPGVRVPFITPRARSRARRVSRERARERSARSFRRLGRFVVSGFVVSVVRAGVRRVGPGRSGCRHVRDSAVFSRVTMARAGGLERQRAAPRSSPPPARATAIVCATFAHADAPEDVTPAIRSSLPRGGSPPRRGRGHANHQPRPATWTSPNRTARATRRCTSPPMLETRGASDPPRRRRHPHRAELRGKTPIAVSWRSARSSPPRGEPAQRRTATRRATRCRAQSPNPVGDAGDVGRRTRRRCARRGSRRNKRVASRAPRLVSARRLRRRPRRGSGRFARRRRIRT